MDQQPVIEIAEFPHDNKLWRIDGLGKIFSQLKNNNNLFIEVYLRPVNFHDNSVYNFAKFDSSGREIPEYNQLKKIPVNIGLLPILRVGSLWIKGKLQNNNAVTDIATLKNIEINANTVEIINSNYKIKYLDSSGREQECKLLLQKNFATDAKVPFSCFKIQNENYKNGIIIPVIEIIRFYYACSTRLAHLTFSNPDEITKISYAIDNETDKVVIKLPQQYTDQEAFILARILTSNIALSGLFQIKNSLIKIGVNEQPTTLLSTNFPFINPTNLMVRGIKIVDRFLVTEICSCSAPFPDISVDRNNDNRKGDKKTDIPDDKKKEYRRGGQTPSLKGNSTIQNQYESVNCVSTLQFNLNINCFSDLIGKKIEKPQKPFNEYKAQKLAINEKINVTSLGVDLGTWSQTTIVPASISTFNTQSEKQNRDALAATFDNSVRAIEHLNEEYSDIQATIYMSSSRACEFVPLTDSAHKAQWSYLVSKTKTRRKVLLGKIEYKDKTFWLIEIQARKSEHFVTAIIYFEAIDETKYLTQLLYVLAKQRGIWDKVPKNSSLQIITLKHTHKDIKSYAQKIHKKISNFILK
ncbi:hypothetical protein M5099_01295 [Neisseria meningitidis]|uniref:hypothetical protein n=1 Tax=Neisseria TaxID=482 RepID=UPI0002D9DF90|nr:MULTISPECIES: hypothetical protein [Neisseria]MBG8615070.1 hypothetical protein [Neisseria meningitidis]MBG8685452.1 hypothetical protein [Neisseria meningitidis]MBG8810219.1 hypothetical protein [Neisseria meningitidis]MBJ7777392.1 hypothetical protein [Neisseria meningitidis]MBJ7827292.1 hypothetical protein [Neisseria meningitidis]